MPDTSKSAIMSDVQRHHALLAAGMACMSSVAASHQALEATIRKLKQAVRERDARIEELESELREAKLRAERRSSGA